MSSSLLDRALHMLALRDHSEAELRRKLAAQPVARQRFKATPAKNAPAETQITEADIQVVIDYCLQNDWLDDARFALRYVNSRSKRGYGEQKIRMELLQKGIQREIIDNAFTEAQIDRSAQAQDVAWKKFGQPLPSDREARAKVQRYLLSRGFSYDEIRSIYINF
ncbi:regulatory protein RecX [Acerihabitans arboris]|uniref:Regulatory protein RecX n=1 Tax=Acerihabitans arboris TaxID=2691583 RepID=A0A845SB88_9GAMM|nr:regulatory protein RecX [Acerihabitans arboris]NDL61179.1 recombination regulator RecX [Acerihabitans arboris]